MTSRLFALLVLLTLVPAAFVLWFMNAAVTAESESARQRVREAYRGQLRLVRARLDPLWRAQAARLAGTGTPSDQFEHLVTDGLAEGVVLLDDAGNVVFPDADARRRLRQMDDLRARDANVFLPTQAALRLSIELADAERPSPLPGTLRETSIAGVWALSPDDGRVVALYRTGRLEAMMHDFLHQVETEGVRFVAFPPTSRRTAKRSPPVRGCQGGSCRMSRSTETPAQPTPRAGARSTSRWRSRASC